MPTSDSPSSDMDVLDTEGKLFSLDVHGQSYSLYLPNAGEDYIQTKIVEEGEPYELEMLSDMGSRLEPEHLVLDVGANIGNHAFYLSEVVGCNVVAFEANQALTFAMQQSLIANNAGERVKIENVALGESSDHCEFEEVIPENIGAQRLICGQGDIAVRALDDFSFEPPVRMLKIDVEGMELAVLKGARGLIARDEPIVYVESQDLEEFTEVQEFLSAFGYLYWDTFNATPTHLFLPKQKTDLTGSDFGDAHLKSAIKSYSLAKVKRNYMKLQARQREFVGLRERLEEEIDKGEKVKRNLGMRRQEAASLKLEIRKLESDISDLLNVNTELEQEKLQQMETIQSQIEELLTVDERTNELLAIGDALEVKTRRLEEQLAARDAQIEGANKRIEALEEAFAKQREEFKKSIGRSEEKRSGHYQKLAQLRSEYDELSEKYQVLEPEFENQKRRLAISERKRSGHYKNLQALREENVALKRTRAFRFQRLLRLSRTPRGLLLFPIGLLKVLFISLPDRKAEPAKAERLVNTGGSAEPSTPALLDHAEPHSATVAPATQQAGEFTLRDEAGLIGWPDVPESKKHLPRVMSVTDEFTTGCFGEDVALIQPRPDNWRALFRKENPELVFIESAWKGNFGSWQYRVAKYANKPGSEVSEMIDYARANAKPSIFWNKEDPVHHEKFMESARLADVIFTTDANMIPSYKEKTGNSKVYALPFAAQPKLHYPAPLNGRIGKACFAGTWYGDRHQARGEAMQWMLKAALPLGLEIFDRNFQTENFNFPEEYHSSIRGGLPYEELCEEYRRYRVFINVNSVVDSPTMFSRRVFELLACGTPVVSSYAKGIEEIFGRDIVWMVESEKEAREAIDVLLHDDSEWRRRSQAGIRAVFSHHTYMHRMQHIYDICGLNWLGATESEICIVVRLENSNDIKKFYSFLSGQSLNEFSVVTINSSGQELDSVSQPVTTIDAALSGDDQFEKLKQLACDAFAFIDLESSYDKNYLLDLRNACLYVTDADVWTKSAAGEEYSEVMAADLFGSLIRKSVLGDVVAAGGNLDSVAQGRQFKIDEQGICLRVAPDKLTKIFS